MGPERFGDNQQTGGVLVEPVHDAGARQFGHLRHAMQEGIEQRAMTVAAAGMDHQADRLVDHHQHGILEHHVERNRLGRIGCGVRIGLDLDPYRLAAADFHLGRGPGVVHSDLAGADPVLDAVARKFRQQGRQGLIQALATLLVGDYQLADAVPGISLIIVRQIFCVFSHA